VQVELSDDRTSFRLRDGREGYIRRVGPDDAGRLIDHVDRASARSRRLRFFTYQRGLDPAFAERLVQLDFIDQGAFAACFPGDERIHGIGRYARIDAETAEVAFLVDDDLQGLGLGSALFRRIVDHASPLGFRRLTALVLGENRPMLGVFRHSGLPMRISHHAETVSVYLDLPWAQAI
jgi:GNAT superfamily N-acetyltransferase